MRHLQMVLKVRLAITALIALLFVPFSLQALTTAELEAEIQALLAQLATLQQGLSNSSYGAATTPAASYVIGQPYPSTATVPSYTTPAAPAQGPIYSCITLSHDVKRGMSGSDIAELQKYLALNAGIYPQGSVSGVFDVYTETAVQRWQAKNGIVPYGSPETNGFGVVGPRTRAAMADCRRLVSAGCPAAPNTPTPSECKSGTWTRTYDANNCHTGWRCSGTYVPPIQCPSRPMPACPDGRVVSKGTARNGCPLGYKCESGSSSCLRDVEAAKNYATGQNCTQVITKMRCPYRSSHTYEARNGCQSGYLEGRDWTSVSGASSATFSASPMSGSVPLAVRFSVGKISFTGIDLGDGQSVQAPLFGMCVSTPCWTTEHTYLSSGTYTAKLLNGYVNGQARVVGTATITVGGSRSSSCPQYQRPLCSNGTLVSNGTDAQGCSLGFRCEAGGGAACSRDIADAVQWAMTANCTAIAPRTLRCPHDASTMYLPRGCEMHYLEPRGWK